MKQLSSPASKVSHSPATKRLSSSHPHFEKSDSPPFVARLVVGPLCFATVTIHERDLKGVGMLDENVAAIGFSDLSTLH